MPAASVFAPRPIRLSETAVLLAVAWLVPFLVHLAPWSGPRPLGVYLLPLFWTAFIAVYFYGARTAILVGLFAPALNALITGRPAWTSLGLTACELAAFALFTALALRRAPRAFVIAPLGYLAARTAIALLIVATGILGDLGSPFDYVRRAVVNGLAGLVVLTAINALLVRLAPRPPAPAV
jgi:uncharacterized membrane protein